MLHLVDKKIKGNYVIYNLYSEKDKKEIEIKTKLKYSLAFDSESLYNKIYCNYTKENEEYNKQVYFVQECVL